MLHRQRFAVHGVRKQHLAAASQGVRQAALETNDPVAVDASGIRASKHDFLRALSRPGAIEHFRQRHAGPFRSADRTKVPLLTGNRWIEAAATVPGALEGYDTRLGGQPPQIVDAEVERSIGETPDREPKACSVEARNPKVIADVKARVGHDHAQQRGDRRFAVERMRAMDDEAIVDGTLTGLFGIQRRRDVLGRERRATASVGDDAGARRCAMNIDSASSLKGFHELAHEALIVGLHDGVHGMLARHDRLPQYFQAIPADVRAAQVVQEHRPGVRIAGGTVFRRVLVTNDEECHWSILYSSRFTGQSLDRPLSRLRRSTLWAFGRRARPAGGAT